MAQEELNAADAKKITGIAILSFIRWNTVTGNTNEGFSSSFITVVFYFFVKNALTVIKVCT